MSGLRKHIGARINRPDKLERGLAKEEALQRGRLWLAMLTAEQRQYLMAIRQARAAVAQARAAMEQARAYFGGRVPR